MREMGYEYLIQTDTTNRDRWDSFLNRLAQDPEHNRSFQVEVTDGSIYFCDYDRGPAAALALRRVIDEALGHCSEVVVKES